MHEVTKEQFKEIFLRLGGAGWDLAYWNAFFEREKKPGVRYFVQEPETPEHNRMMIVNDSTENLHRLFFQTEEAEERFFDYPDKS
jgi:hypothetical protein